MRMSTSRLISSSTAVLIVMSMASTAQAEDFLSALFGAFGVHHPQPPMTPMSYGGQENASGTTFPPEGPVSRPRTGSHGGGSQAYCVRTCDGRYFPISATSNQSRAASCNSFCPAAETKVVYGSHIDSAVTDGGRSYSELPNAFRYRNELVAGCTCNGKDPIGLAAVKIENDPTLRRGDIVAGPNGLMMAARTADRRGASLDLSPAPDSIRARYQRVPVVASQ